MSPETLTIDRTFRGVGRIKKATGTTEKVMRGKLSRMLTALYEDGRLDLLRAIRDNKLTLLQVYDAYRRRALEDLPLGETMLPLADTMKIWIEALRVPHDVSKKHKESLETSRRYLEKHEKRALVNDLPRLVEELRQTLGAKHPRSFNLLRSAALAFARATLKKTHPIYQAVAAVEPRKIPRRLQRKGVRLSVEQAINLFPAPQTDPVDAIAWTMLTTGMHAEEYWGEWSRETDRVHVAGTKRAARMRDVPLVMVPVAPPMHRRTFEDKLRERTRAIQAYDIRRTYSHWMELAAIPRTRRKLYMGHGVKDVTDLYERHEVDAFLASDAVKLATYIRQASGAAPLAFIGSPTELHTMTLYKKRGA